MCQFVANSQDVWWGTTVVLQDRIQNEETVYKKKVVVLLGIKDVYSFSHNIGVRHAGENMYRKVTPIDHMVIIMTEILGSTLNTKSKE